MARPPLPFDEELADYLCERLANSEDGVEKILRERKDKGLSSVSHETIYKWLRDDARFAEQYAQARDVQATLLHDRAGEWSITPLPTEIVTDGPKGKEVRTVDNVQRSNLMVTTALKRAGQLAPKRYGEKVQHVGGAGKDDAPIKHIHTVSVFDEIINDGKDGPKRD
jgi:hypothetical protein